MQVECLVLVDSLEIRPPGTRDKGGTSGATIRGRIMPLKREGENAGLAVTCTVPPTHPAVAQLLLLARTLFARHVENEATLPAGKISGRLPFALAGSDADPG